MDNKNSLSGIRIPRKDYVYLFSFFLGYFLYLVTLGGFRHTTPGISPEALSYIDAPFHSLDSALSYVRTIGYPIILKSYRFFFPDFLYFPIFQHLLFYLSATLFFISLRKISFSTLESLGTTALITLSFPPIFFHTVSTELPSFSFILITISLLILYCQKPNVLLLISWSLSLFIAIQIRPMYLFVLPLCLILGCFFRYTFFKDNLKSFIKGYLFKIFLGAFAPLLLFCSFRFYLVDEFGLVPFNGAALSGIATQFLKEEDLKLFSGDTLTFAQNVFQKKKELSPDPNHPDYYDIMKWQICIPIAKEQYSEQWIPMNKTMQKYAVPLLLHHFSEYMVWSYRELKEYVIPTYFYISRMGFILKYMIGGTLALWFFNFLLSAYIKRPNFWPQLEIRQKSNFLFLLGLFFILPGVLMLILVIDPQRRYLQFLYPFFVCAPFAWCLWLIQTSLSTPLTLSPNQRIKFFMMVISVVILFSFVLYNVLILKNSEGILLFKGKFYTPTPFLIPAIALGLFLILKAGSNIWMTKKGSS